jgi:hypothetical protein
LFKVYKIKLYKYEGGNIMECIKVSRKKYNNGWTYAEAHKIWRMDNREAKLNKGWVRENFKEWIKSLIV